MRIAITGNIGVGKTTLVEALGKKEGYRSHKEDVDREILKIFTDVNLLNKRPDLKKHKPELLNQFHFLNETITRDIKAYYDTETKHHIFDRTIIEHIYVFARENLSYSDYALYHGMQELFLNQMNWQKYDINFILVDSTESIKNKINKRGRNEEEMTPEYAEYIETLNNIYNSREFKEVCNEYAEHLIFIDVNKKSADQVLKEVEKWVEHYEQFYE